MPKPAPRLRQELQNMLETQPGLTGGESGAHARQVLLETASQIERSLSIGHGEADAFLAAHPIRTADRLPHGEEVAVPGVQGAFTHMAALDLFQAPRPLFFEEFHGVMEAVQSGRVRFGVLPVENSSAGAVTQTLDLIAGKKLYISRATVRKVEHFFCAHPDTDPAAIRTVISHPQALAQCEEFRRKRGLAPTPYSNTATAAQKVLDSPGEPLGCICSLLAAQLYGLRVLEEQVQDFDENYTRFVCISRDNLVLPGADRITLSLSFPNEPGALMNLLTRFAACRLNLTKIVSMPIASRDFNVRFHLDFTGRVQDTPVAALLGSMLREYPSFHYLGNYHEL